MEDNLYLSIARVFEKGRGVAFLIEKFESPKNGIYGLWLSCTHVVGLKKNIDAFVSENSHSPLFSIKIQLEIENQLAQDKGDLTLLSSKKPLGNHLIPLKTTYEWDSIGHKVSMFGFPKSNRVNGIPENNILIQSVRTSNNKGFPQIFFKSSGITKGFSGSPIFDTKKSAVIGIVRELAKVDINGKMRDNVYGIPMSFIHEHFPELAPSPNLPINSNKVSVPGDKIIQFIDGEKIEFPKEITSIPNIVLEDIIGRKKELDQILEHLNSSNKVLLVNGIGGIGKSTLAKCYPLKYYSNYNHFIWIDVLSNFNLPKTIEDKKEQFIDAFVNNFVLLNNLKLNIDESFPKDIKLKIILNRIQNIKGNNLIIIDNTTDAIEYFDNFLPKSPNWKMLITSRERMTFFKELEIKNLELDDAKKLFYSHYDLEENDKYVISLLNSVELHTLTIELLAKSAKSLELTIENFVKLIDIEGIKKLDLPKIRTKYISEIGSLIPFAYLLKAFNISNLSENHKLYLSYFSILPSIDIPLKDMTTILGLDIKKSLKLKNTLDTLSSKGWLISDGPSIYRIHQVIQDVIKYQLSPDFNNCKELIDGVTKAVDYSSYENQLEKINFIPYGETILENIKTNNIEIARLYNSLSVLVEDVGQFQKSIFLANQALKMGKSFLKVDDDFIAEVHNNLGWTYMLLENFDEAIVQYKRALDIRENIIPPASRLPLAITYNDLGWTLRVSKKYSDAKKYLEKALKIRLEELGEFSPEVGQTYSNLSVVLIDMGENKTSIDMGKKALEIKEKLLGRNHIDVSTSYNNLAFCLNKNGNYLLALENILTCIEIEEKTIGKEHHLYSLRNYNLGLILQNLNRVDEAIVAFEKSLEVAKINYPKSHNRVIDAELKLVELKTLPNNI